GNRGRSQGLETGGTAARRVASEARRVHHHSGVCGLAKDRQRDRLVAGDGAWGGPPPALRRPCRAPGTGGRRGLPPALPFGHRV
ncbi:MAG: hypothetical protein AVDCRST_MAG22-1238, partial [uncultured Rubrobacteraceae bacterium]